MKLINASSGKMGSYVIGPKQFLNEPIKLGEVAICIGRDEKYKNGTKPCIWLIGGIERLVDYICLARTQGELQEDVVNHLLSQIDKAKEKIPSKPIDRLASVMNIESSDLQEFIDIAQVYISSPIVGVKDYSEGTPKYISKVNSR